MRHTPPSLADPSPTHNASLGASLGAGRAGTGAGLARALSFRAIQGWAAARRLFSLDLLPARLFLSRLVPALLLVVLVSLPGTARDGELTLRREALSVTTAAGTTHRFEVEIADTPAARSRGLMYREALAADARMLFDIKSDGQVAIWMKNTLIPLDMLFIERGGRIAGIAENTVPLSEALVPSGAVVRFVLEVPGGTSAALGIGIGDRVDSPTIQDAAPR